VPILEYSNILIQVNLHQKSAKINFTSSFEISTEIKNLHQKSAKFFLRSGLEIRTEIKKVKKKQADRPVFQLHMRIAIFFYSEPST